MRISSIKVPNLKRTAGVPIRTLDAPGRVRLPIGSLVPLVSVGDRVEHGQLIAESQNDDQPYRCAHAPFTSTVSANLHSATASGPGRTLELLRYDPRITSPFDSPSPGTLPDGASAGGEAILESSLNDEPRAHDRIASACRIPDDLAQEEIIEIARRAGLVGMGGGTFPTYLKLNPKNSIDWIIVNGCESEPYATCDHRVLVEHREEVECGMRLAIRAAGAANGTIATGEHEYLDGYESRLTFKVLGRTVPVGRRPVDVGVLIINVQTARALHRAVCESRALTDRVVTVDGDAITRPGSYVIPIGTEVGHVLHVCGVDWNKVALLIAGGPMMGSPTRPDATVTAGTTAILALAKHEVAETSPDPCIRCGRCQDVCALGLPVAQLLRRPTNQWLLCIECGMCQFACPARRPMLSRIRELKNELNGQQP